jgi:hypothetical protein
MCRCEEMVRLVPQQNAEAGALNERFRLAPRRVVSLPGPVFSVYRVDFQTSLVQALRSRTWLRSSASG